MSEDKKAPILIPGVPDLRGRPRKYYSDRPASSAERTRALRARRAAAQNCGTEPQWDIARHPPSKNLRILAISDIHDTVAAVRHLREKEENNHDIIVVTGDIGCDKNEEIFGILETFDCPVLYVLGNHDLNFSVSHKYRKMFHHIHLSPVCVHGIWFVGMSEYMGYPRKELAYIARQAVGPVVIVSHERFTGAHSDMGNAFLFLFGHLHAFRETTYKGARYLQVGALAERVTVKPKGLSPTSFAELRNTYLGRYAQIEISRAGVLKITRRILRDSVPKGWERVEEGVYWDAPSID